MNPHGALQLQVSVIPYTKLNRVLCPIPGDGKTIEFFHLLFDEILYETIVRQTNKKAEKLNEKHLVCINDDFFIRSSKFRTNILSYGTPGQSSINQDCRDFFRIHGHRAPLLASVDGVFAPHK